MTQTPDSEVQAREDRAREVLARQLRLYRVAALCLAAALLAGGAAFLLVRHLGQPVTVLVGGRPVGTVRNAAAASALVEAAEKAAVGPAFAQEEPVRMQAVRFVPAPASAPQDPDGTVTARLARLLTLRVPAYVILVGGHPSLALPTPDAATQTLRLVEDHWAAMPPAAPVQGRPQIVQPIAIVKHTVDTRRTRASAAQAAPYFWTPPPSRTYVVRPGDLGGRIARRAHLTLGELVAANPGKDLNRLTPGDVVSVQKMPLLLSVRVRKQLVATEKVRPGAPASVAGLQRVTYLVTYLNGQEVHREARSVVIEQRPKLTLEL